MPDTEHSSWLHDVRIQLNETAMGGVARWPIQAGRGDGSKRLTALTPASAVEKAMLSQRCGHGTAIVDQLRAMAH